jgi:hypothetical protein
VIRIALILVLLSACSSIRFPLHVSTTSISPLRIARSSQRPSEEARRVGDRDARLVM